MKRTNKSTQKNAKKTTSKQIVALGGVILLVLMYLVTLVVAIVDQSEAGKLFQACMVATIAIPFLIWIYIWMYGKLTNKHTMADLDIGAMADLDIGAMADLDIGGISASGEATDQNH